MDRPDFTAEQLEWLKANLPRGPFDRTLGDVVPASDAQNEAAYALLTAEQRAIVDQHLAQGQVSEQVTAAKASLAAATAQVVTAASEAQQVVTTATAAGVDTSTLEAALATVQPVVEANAN